MKTAGSEYPIPNPDAPAAVGKYPTSAPRAHPPAADKETANCNCFDRIYGINRMTTGGRYHAP